MTITAIRKRATVLSFDASNIVVSLRPDTDTCESCTGCALANLCHGRETAVILHLPLPPGIAAPPVGQEVLVAYEPADPAMAAVVLFLPTLIGLILGGSLAYHTDLAEIWIVASALAGAGIGILVTALINTHHRLTRPAARWLPEE